MRAKYRLEKYFMIYGTFEIRVALGNLRYMYKEIFCPWYIDTDIMTLNVCLYAFAVEVAPWL